MERESLLIETLRNRLGHLRDAEDFDGAQSALDAFAATLSMPLMAWSPDVAQPYFDEEMDAFMRRQGWPEAILEMWWSRHATLKMPYYIRCRFEHLPFVTSLKTTRRGAVRRTMLKEQQVAVQITSDMGINTLMTVPIHLPKGQVAMLTWATEMDPVRVRAVAETAEPELLAAGHYFMRAYLRTHGTQGVTQEELSRLTPREWDCLRLTAQGYKEIEVGRLAGIAATTVRYHLDNVVEKLGAANRKHAVALAAQLGLLGPISS